MADDLKDLLNSLNEARVVDRLCQLDMSEMAGAFGHVFGTSATLELPVNGAQHGVVKALITWLRTCLVHGFRIDDVNDAHILDLLW